MGVVGSLPSPLPPSSIMNDTIKDSPKECTDCVIMKNETDCNSNFASNSNSNIDNQNEPNNYMCTDCTSIKKIMYGPICVKIRRSVSLTLATGRRSKFIKLEGNEAIQREIRRQRNRDAAKKLKEKRNTIEQQLQKDIQELESKEQELLSNINNLESYKKQLEMQYKHVVSIQETLVRTASSTLKHIHQNGQRLNHSISVHENDIHIKDEQDPPSPQWQLLFSI